MRIFTPLRPPTGRLRRLPLALFPELFDFALDEVALQHAEMLEKKNAVEMIDLMAEGAGEKIFAANFVGFAFGVLGFYGDKLRTDDVAAEAGNREAALFFADFSLGVNDFGIGQDDLGFGIFSAGDVDHGEAKTQADLRRGEAHALRSVHGSEHVFDELLHLRVKFFDGRAGLLKDGIAVLDDRINLDRLCRRFRRGDRGSLLCSGCGRRQWLRTRRFVGHSCRNSAASRRGSLLQIFAEKRRLTQVRPWLRRRLPRWERRTSRSARTRPAPVPW